jgi:hypothetical protein
LRRISEGASLVRSKGDAPPPRHLLCHLRPHHR